MPNPAAVTTPQPATKTRSHVGLYLGLVFATVLAFVLGYFRILPFYQLTDRLTTISYTMPEDTAELATHLPLTPDAQLIYRASRPQLEDAAAFNEHCQSHDVEISILGCYVDSRIYIYNIQNQELAGIRESNAAHELLHAIWDRLSVIEQYSLGQELANFYHQHPDQVNDSIDLYSEDELIDELHSRLGTEVKNLPETLERHYAKYFTDQDAVVDYYLAYSAPFEELAEEFQQLTKEIETQKNEIATMREQYHERSDALDAKIDQFNACANREGCFTDAESSAQRSALVAEQDALEQYFHDLNAKIEAYNQLIDQYNANILHNRELETAINSNAPPLTESLEQTN